MNPKVVVLVSFPLLVIGIFAAWQFAHGPQAENTYVLTPLPDLVKRDTQPTNRPQQTASTASSATSTSTATPLTTTNPPLIEPVPLRDYLEITTGCSLVVDDTCVAAYARPDGSSAIKNRLRIGTVLSIKGTITGVDGNQWYEIDFPEWLRYPERLSLPWYVPYTAGVVVRMNGPEDLTPDTATSTKKLLVDRSDQTLYAYEGEELIRTYSVSTGRELTPTPRGTFTVFRKTPSRYMQGPIPGISTNYYDLPGVPWNLYFTKQGAVVHGAYWHNDFGNPHSNGCVNVDPKEARELYDWAEIGTQVIVRD